MSHVNTLLLKLKLKWDELIHRTEGQDLVEYALVMGILCFGVAASSQFISASLAKAFTNLNTTMSSYVS
jgi:Flp pilus assembly pilin Flp